jgi:hypothetical protein
MKTRVIIIALGTALAMGMAAPSWAQGSLEKSDNGPSAAQSGPTGNMPKQPQAAPPATTGQAPDANNRLPNAPNAQTPGSPNNPKAGPTDRSGNVPSDNR